MDEIEKHDNTFDVDDNECKKASCKYNTTRTYLSDLFYLDT